MTTVSRTAYPRLSERASADELRTCFSLTAEDKAFILDNAKGSRQRQTFAVMLATRRWLGYFLAKRSIPDAINGFVIDQLDTQQLADGVTSVPKQSLSRYRQRIRGYIGAERYADKGRAYCESAVLAAALTMSDPADLVNVAIDALTKANIELPAFSTLDRLVGNLRTTVHESLFATTAETLNANQELILDALMEVNSGEATTGFAQLKRSPGPPTLKHMRLWAKRLATLDALLDPRPHLTALTHTKIRQFSSEATALSIADMRGISSAAKRRTFLLCLLHDAQCSTRDELIEMFLRRMRRTQNAAMQRLQSLQASHREIEEQLLGVLGQVVNTVDDEKTDAQLGSELRDVLLAYGGLPKLKERLSQVSAYHQSNYLPLLWPIHVNARSAIFDLLGLLKLRSATQDTRILDALSCVIEHRHSRRRTLPADLNIDFASKRWHQFILVRTDEGVMLDRRHLEIGVLIYLADALRSGDVFVEESEDYADYREQLIPWDQCQPRIKDYCSALGMPDTAKSLVRMLQDKLTQTANDVDRGFSNNSNLTIDSQGVPHLKRLQAAPIPARIGQFERIIRERMPERHLLDILKNVENWCGYTRHFGPPSGSEAKLPDAHRRYLLTVFGYGCNLGASQTARHAAAIANRHTLRRINAQHINSDKLEAAGADIVAEYVKFDIQKLWGTGQAAIADGTHMELRENNLMGQQHIRYGGYGAIAYHHISDNYIALFSNFIACGVWEAVYILDGLLLAPKALSPDTLHADTHGQSEPVFALAWLLGIKLFPRMRTWNDVKFYRASPGNHYKHLDPLFKENIDWALIERHWADMMQVVLSIQAGEVLPSMLLRRLGVHNRKNRLYRAFRELGRVVRTLFLLRYISETELRQTIRSETTKIESFNDFLDWISFGSPVIKSGDPVEQGKRVKYSSVVANAIMLHNVVDLTAVVNELVAEGITVTEEMVAHLSPFMREKIQRFGRYDLEIDSEPTPLQPIPLNI